jgi:hypothetical protein
MEPPAAPIPPETLLAHTGWMRRLARSLVRDDAQAEDVVQDAVAAAMRRPPRDALALPAWLATAVRNGARQLWRGDLRRARREDAAARPEAVPGTAEVVARAEEHGLVVQAVLTLDEPHRSALLLRCASSTTCRRARSRSGSASPSRRRGRGSDADSSACASGSTARTAATATRGGRRCCRSRRSRRARPRPGAAPAPRRRAAARRRRLPRQERSTWARVRRW